MTRPPVHPGVLSGYGLVEAPFDRVVERLGTGRRAATAEFDIVDGVADRTSALEYLDHRTVPATRLVVVEHGAWTAVLTNHRNGSDFADHQHLATERLGVRTIRVDDAGARWWTRGRQRERLAYEGRIFEFRGPGGESIRSIACVDDGGRWTFETAGDALPVEASFRYDAPRKKDRLSRADLHVLLRSVGAEPLTEEAILAAPRFALLAERLLDPTWSARVEAESCSLAEAEDPALGYYRRGMTWVPHMATHATSVIADFERAIAIDPAYEPRVRDHLREARRIVEGSS